MSDVFGAPGSAAPGSAAPGSVAPAPPAYQPPTGPPPAVEEFPVGPVDGELLDATTSGEYDADPSDAFIEGEYVDVDEHDVDEHDVDPSDDEDGGAQTPDLVLDTWQIELPATGDASVDAALARLTDVEGLPPAEHVAVYEAVHAGLNEALADLDRA